MVANTKGVEAFFHANIVLFAQITKVDFIFEFVSLLEITIGECIEAGSHDGDD